ncbi:UNVERIFIED_CONTAM: hypothetical protein Sradi_5420600 [Sesamum radiatum]|uniref:Retrotransposon Copia-like N-terminal domain-containing protein n=1 Tax=Sesamum radiatum TaxID=300843 RepID=A0AAW2L8N3_SESRA
MEMHVELAPIEINFQWVFIRTDIVQYNQILVKDPRVNPLNGLRIFVNVILITSNRKGRGVNSRPTRRKPLSMYGIAVLQQCCRDRRLKTLRWMLTCCRAGYSKTSFEGLCIPQLIELHKSVISMADAGESSRQSVPEALQLHGSDHPGMILVSTLLTKSNYLTWSYAVKRALRAKMKLGFIDGTTMKQHSTDLFFEQWICVDSMVTTWILNRISKEIVGSFMYAKSARTLWLDLEERYGECNRPLLYQLQREITSLAQGNMSIVEYFSKLRMVWDEIDKLMPTPQCTCGGCTCGVSKATADQATFTRLFQFLIGLSETFDHLRDQLLVMDPVLTVNKAYSMVLRVEKQREVSVDCTNTMDNTTMQVRAGNKREYIPTQGDTHIRRVNSVAIVIVWVIPETHVLSFTAPLTGIRI